MPLGLVAHLSLTNPQAIAAASDGTIYLIDAERLKVLRATPSTTPLPPIPAPAPARSQPLLCRPPLCPPLRPLLCSLLVRRSGAYDQRYRHYGYRHYRHFGGGQF